MKTENMKLNKGFTDSGPVNQSPFGMRHALDIYGMSVRRFECVFILYMTCGEEVEKLVFYPSLTSSYQFNASEGILYLVDLTWFAQT